MSIKHFLSSFLLFTLLVTMGAGCGDSKAEEAAAKPVTLTIWRVFDGSDSFEDIMNNYRTVHPNVSFEYKKMRFEEYEDELIEAFAKGKGPDIFSIHNTWVGGYKDLIKPLPETITIPYTETRGTLKKETITELRKKNTLTLTDMKKQYVDVVKDDVVISNKIYALPMALDTLVLYYNGDLLNAAGIPEPPKTWIEFQEAVKLLTKVDAQGKLLQSGAALGSGENIERASDILSVLMLQTGTTMTDSQGRAIFASEDEEKNPAISALRFYTDFASPLKEVYTWNKEQANSFDAFVGGKTAFFFGYAYHLPLIKNRSPKLDVRITSLPQIGGGKEVNIANYWLETVSKSSKQTDWAWDFIEFATSEEQVTTYLEATNKPTARRALIKNQLEDEQISVFVSQILTAKTWYHGKDASVMEQAFIDLIEEVLSGKGLQDPLIRAQNKINQTL